MPHWQVLKLRLCSMFYLSSRYDLFNSKWLSSNYKMCSWSNLRCWSFYMRTLPCWLCLSYSRYYRKGCLWLWILLFRWWSHMQTMPWRIHVPKHRWYRNHWMYWWLFCPYRFYKMLHMSTWILLSLSSLSFYWTMPSWNLFTRYLIEMHWMPRKPWMSSPWLY